MRLRREKLASWVVMTSNDSSATAPPTSAVGSDCSDCMAAVMAVGKQVLATKKTNPRPIIGGYAAAALEELRAFSRVSPGPAAYHVPRSTTRQLQAGKKTPPARSFGTAARFGGGGIRPSSARRIVDEPTPGPGAYNPA